MVKPRFLTEGAGTGPEGVAVHHERITGMFGELRAAVSEGRVAEKNHALLRGLSAFLEAYFKLEETVMRAAGYGVTEEHAREHLKLLENLNTLVKAVRESRLRPEGLSELLEEWWETHRKGWDNRFALYFKKSGPQAEQPGR